MDGVTLYDKIVGKLKNNKLVVVLLIAFAVVLGLAELQGALSGISKTLFPPKTTIRVSAWIERYDFMVGRTGPAKPLTTVDREVAQMDEIADQIAGDVASTLGAIQNSLQATLRIQEGKLRSSQPLRVAVIIVQSPMSQVGRVSKNLGETDTVDIRELSGQADVLDSRNDAIDLELESIQGGLQRMPIRIFKRGTGFSFSADHDELERAVTLTPRKFRLIVEAFKANGEGLENVRNALDSSLRQNLAKFPALELSSMTVEELDKRRKELQERATPGGGKSHVAEELSADEIVSGTITLK